MRYDPSDYTSKTSTPAYEVEADAAEPRRKRPFFSFMKAASAAGVYFYMTSIPGNADLEPAKRSVTVADRLVPDVVVQDPYQVPKIKVRTTSVAPDYDVQPRIVTTIPAAGVPLVFQPVDATKACSPSLVHADKFAAVAVIVRADGREEVVLDVGADLPRHPASMTKMMTLLVAFQRIEAKRIERDWLHSFPVVDRVAESSDQFWDIDRMHRSAMR